MKDVRTKLREGDYNTKLPYNKESFQAYSADSRRLKYEFKADALAEVGLANHPKAEKIWAKACDSHHSYGYLEVLQELEELAELFLS